MTEMESVKLEIEIQKKVCNEKAEKTIDRGQAERYIGHIQGLQMALDIIEAYTRKEDIAE